MRFFKWKERLIQPQAQILHKCFVVICFLDVQNGKYHLLFSGSWLGANPGNYYWSLHVFVSQTKYLSCDNLILYLDHFFFITLRIYIHLQIFFHNSWLQVRIDFVKKPSAVYKGWQPVQLQKQNGKGPLLKRTVAN